jgi:hypothetical protein
MLMDDHVPSNLDIFWDFVFSRKRPTVRIGQFQSKLHFEHGVFIPPGCSSFLYKSNEKGLSCDPGSDGVAIMRAFSQHVLRSFGIERRSFLPTDIIHILLVSRNLYKIGSLQHKFVGRQIENKEEVIPALKSIPGFNVSIVEYRIPIEEQIRLVSSLECTVQDYCTHSGYHCMEDC